MMPSRIDIKPMVTMITDMIGSPMRRRRKIRSTLMARKKVITMLTRKETKIGRPTQAVSE